MQVADRKQLERLVGKTMLDVDFRDRLLRDPARTAESIGMRLSAAQADRIRHWDPDVLGTLAGPFEDWLSCLIDWLMSLLGNHRGW
jgi:hypothetical protein